MKYGEKGPKVRKLQEQLISAGYELPLFGVDGHLGEETWDALKEFALDHKFVWAPTISDGLVDSLLKEMKENPIDILERVQFFDVRNEPVPFNKADRFRMRSNRVVRRPAHTIDCIVIHQTGVEFSVSNGLMDKFGGNRRRALAYRSKNIPAPAVSFDGFYVKNYPLDFYCYHAGHLNRRSLGLEIDGLYAGVRNDPKTVWKGLAPTFFTEERRDAARAALKYLVEEGRAKGMPIHKIYAHRQSSGTRRADPGQEIWEEVVENYAVPVLGLKTENEFTINTGRPIPKEWSSTGVDDY